MDQKPSSDDWIFRTRSMELYDTAQRLEASEMERLKMPTNIEQKYNELETTLPQALGNLRILQRPLRLPSVGSVL